jgi:hypothetical protein
MQHFIQVVCPFWNALCCSFRTAGLGNVTSVFDCGCCTLIFLEYLMIQQRSLYSIFLEYPVLHPHSYCASCAALAPRGTGPRCSAPAPSSGSLDSKTNKMTNLNRIRVVVLGSARVGKSGE